jgi:hypothetical protein
MARDTAKQNINRKSSERLVGVCAAARALGCSRGHLTKVLRGERQSKSLVARFQALKASQKSFTPAHS